MRCMNSHERIAAALALVWQLTALTDPNAPPEFVWLWIPVIALTAWLVVRRGHSASATQNRFVLGAPSVRG